MKRFLVYSSVVLALGAAFAGGFWYQQREINDLHRKNTTYSKELDTLRAQLEEKSAATTSPSGTTSGASTDYTSEKGIAVKVTKPSRSATITTPLTVTGTVPGSWSFEGQFSVRLIDAQGNLLADAPAKIDGDWMTEDPVTFSATLQFGTGASTSGTLVLVKANPSGLASNNDTVVVPVKF